jgi:hypothetical protein
MVLFSEGLKALKKVAKEVGLDLRGAHLQPVNPSPLSLCYAIIAIRHHDRAYQGRGKRRDDL